jgi:hypothetical protein
MGPIGGASTIAKAEPDVLFGNAGAEHVLPAH